MKKIDKVIKRETFYVFYISAIFSILLQSIFLIIQKWDYTLILGNIYGLVAAVSNFFLMGISVQSALQKNPDDAKKQIKLSQSLRLLMLFVLAAIAYLIFHSNIYSFLTAIIPYLFPRIAIALRPLFKKD